MEGYLFKKGRGDSSFGRRNWKKRWFVLEDQLLTYYEDIDLNTGIPVTQKGMTDISGCEVIAAAETDKPFVFVVKHPTRPPLSLQADDAKMMNIWIKSLSTAAVTEPKVPLDYDLFYEKLGLDASKNPTLSEINRAYRKAALKVHPDKGGDLVEFKKLQEAFEQLTTKLEEDEANKEFTTIEYEAVIGKGPQGVGVGMVVIENIKTGIIQIKKVMPTIMIQSITSNAKNEIRPGDVLIKVGQENVVGMPLSRVVQKIGDIRVPVGSSVKMTFTRRLHKDGTPEVVSFGDDKPTNTVFTPNPNDASSSSKNQSPNNSNNNSSYNFNAAPPDSHHSAPSTPLRSENESFATPSHLDPVQYVSVMAENEELKMDLETSLTQLNQAYHERDTYKADCKQLKNELSKYKALLADSLKRQRLLELQVQQNLVYNTVSAEQLSQSREELVSLSAKLQNDQLLQVSNELNSYMQTVGLDGNDVRNDRTKLSQRTAITASAAMDKSGVMVQKWATAGDSVVNKLSRFEQNITKIENNRQNTDNTAIYLPPTTTVASSSPVADSSAPRNISTTTTRHSPVPVPSVEHHSTASPLSLAGAAFSVSAAIRMSNVLSPKSVNNVSYKGLSGGGPNSFSPTRDGTQPRPALSRAMSEMSSTGNGAFSTNNKPSSTSPLGSFHRAASTVISNKTPIAPIKRATPTVPMNRQTSSFQ